MAKRVNKKFVAILGISLFAVAGGAAIMFVMKRHQHEDWGAVKAKAEAAEKAGDMVNAVALYQRAAGIASGVHAPGSDALWAKLADLSMTLSADAKSSDDGVRYYQVANAALQRALSENPRNLTVNEKLMEQQYQIAQLDRSSSVAWNQLEDLATRFINNEPKPIAKAFIYRGEAKLRFTQNVNINNDVPESRLSEIDNDLLKAISLEPDAGKPVGLRGELIWLRAKRAETRGAKEDAAKLYDTLDVTLKEFLKRHPNDPDVVEVLSGATYQQGASLVGEAVDLQRKNGPGDADKAKSKLAESQVRFAESLAAVKNAYAAHKGNARLGELLGRMYQDNRPPALTPKPDLVEQIDKELIDGKPGDAGGYARLGLFYQNRKKVEEAIAMFKECINHANSGGGLEAFKNTNMELQSSYFIAWLNMDLAEAKGAFTDAGKAALAESAVYTEKFRVAHGSNGMLNLLDGRMALLKNQIPAASKLLRLAEDTLKKEQIEQLMQVDLLLARVYLQVTPAQTGLALEYLDKVIAIQRGRNALNSSVLLDRAVLLTQLAKYADAQQALDELLKFREVLPPPIVERALRLLALAKNNMGDHQGSEDILSKLTENVGANLQLAGMYMAESDNAGALELLNHILEKEPDNQQALRLAAIVLFRLERKDEAIKIVDRALEKYPKVSEFQVLKGMFTQADPSSKEATIAIISTLSDDYIKQMQFANAYRSYGEQDKEIAALKAAEGTIGADDNSPESQRKRSEVIERIFSAYSRLAIMAKDDAVKAEDWRQAEIYVQRAERANNGAGIDGVGGKLYRGRLELMRSDGKSGLDLIVQASQQRPDYALGHTVLAQAYYVQKRFDLALAEYRQAVRLIPNNLSLIVPTIELLLQNPKVGSKDIDEAKNLLTLGLAIAPHDPRLARYADLLADLPKAISTREGMLKEDPNNIENIRFLAILYMRNKAKDDKAIDKAVDLIKPLYEKNPKDMDLLTLLAHLYGEKNQIDEGAKLFEPLIASSDSKIKFDALIALGEFSKEVSRIDDAVRSFHEAMKVQPEGNDDAERHLGDLYFDIEDMANAEATYRSLFTKSKPGSPRLIVLRRLIETQVRQRKFAEADQLLNTEILSKDPDDVQGLLLRAFSNIQQGGESSLAKEDPQNPFNKALKDVDRVLAKSPEMADALYYRALAQFSMRGNLDQAIKDLLTIRNRDRTGLNSRVLLAQVYTLSQRYEQAVNEYDEILHLRPELFNVRREFAQLLMALSEAQQKLSPGSTDEFSMSIRRVRPVDALHTLLKASTALYPDQVIWPLMDANLLSLVGNAIDAQRLYAFIYKAVPQDPLVTTSYLQSLLQTKNYEEVIDISNAMIKNRPDVPDIYMRRATAYAGLKKTEQAVADVDFAIDLSMRTGAQLKDYSVFIAILSQSQTIVSPEAIAESLRARLAKDPRETMSGVGLMHMLILLGKPSEAVEVSKSLHVPDDLPTKIILARETAMAQFQSKNYQAAYSGFMELFKLLPNDIESLNNFAFMTAENLNKPKDALPYINRAAQIMQSSGNMSMILSNSGNIYDTLGWVKYLAGDSEGAVNDLRRSLQAQPMPLTYVHLANAYKKSNRIDEARSTVEDGLRLPQTAGDAVVSDQLKTLQRELMMPAK